MKTEIKYPVNDIYPAVQGEGVQTGVPMIMLRLHGCDVGCPFCDTKETWYLEPENERQILRDALGTNELYTRKGADYLAAYLFMNFPNLPWALVSGGEPAQYDLGPLVKALHRVGYKVAIETSGTETGHVGAGFDWVCVSPKIGMPGGKTIQAEAVKVADEIKFVIGKEADLQKSENFLTSFERKESCQICLQPMSLSPKATQLCIETVQKRRGWRLSVQVHRFLNIP